MVLGYEKKVRPQNGAASAGRWAAVGLLAWQLLNSTAAAERCPNGQPGHLSQAQVQAVREMRQRAERLKSHANQADRDSALDLLLRAHAQLKGVYSEELYEISSLLADIYLARGPLKEARAHAEKALEIHGCIGAGELALVDDLQFLAQIEMAEERFAQALNHARSATAPCDRLSDEKAPPLFCVEARNVLAIILQKQGLFDEAEKAYSQVLVEGTRWFPAKRPTYLQNLATFHHEIGAYEDAVRELEDARLTVAPEDRPDVLENLAAAYDALATQQRQAPGQEATAEATWNKADVAFREAIASAEQAARPLEKRSAILNNQAYHLAAQHRYKAAEQACREGLALIKPEERHPIEGATLRFQLSRLYADQNLLQEALAQHKAALALLDPHDGRDLAQWAPTTLLLEVLVKGAALHEQVGQTNEAKSKLEVALRISEDQLERVGSSLASGRVRQFVEALRQSAELAYQFAYRHRDDPAMVALGLRTVLLRKDRAQEAAVNQSRMMTRQTSDAYQQQKHLLQKVGELAAVQKGSLDVLDVQRTYDNQVEVIMGRTPGERGRQLPRPEIIEAAVRQQLGGDAALIEVAAFGSSGSPPGRRYVAFLVWPGRATQVVDLGLEDALEATLAKLRHDLVAGTWWHQGPV